jgi:hypothetical protein
MNVRHLLLATILCFGLAATAWAGAPATPADGAPARVEESAPPGAAKALGDPSDWLASARAGAAYLVMMQADISETEDNAGNGLIDDDPDDGGWDWATAAFQHSTAASPGNITGATAQGLYQVYLIDPTPAIFTAMKDAADGAVTRGPTEVRSASDVSFLLDFADLPDCPDPAYYRQGARDIWDWNMANRPDGTAAGFAAYIRDYRGITNGYPNGIIAWDLSMWVEALVQLDAAFSGAGFDADAVAVVEVMWQDSFNGTPGFFDPNGANKGNDPDYAEPLYYWYSIGVSGLIKAFALAGDHDDEIPGLLTLMQDCQYPDGAYCYQYGAPTDYNDRDWQNSAYCAMALYESVPHTPATFAALRAAGTWLAATQDVGSGGWVYDSGNHYPEVCGEATAAVANIWATAGAAVTASVDGPDPVACGVTKTVTFRYEPEDATPGLRGYEITFTANAPVVSFDAGDIHDSGSLAALGLHAYYVVDNLDGSYTVTDALLGTTGGLTAAGDLFHVELETADDGLCEVEVLSYRMRDPVNADIFVDVSGLSFTVDCTAPPAVTDIACAPGHEKVTVTWNCDETDVDHYAVFRGLWYDGVPNVSAYPEYNDQPGWTEPTRPVDYADAVASDEWVPVDDVPVGTLFLVDEFAPRGYYSYEVFAVDAVGYVGPAAADNDEATNYWLGDVQAPYDGDVDNGDITVLGAAFGYTNGVGGYDAECDVGPTDDASGFGFPTTDNVVDFEDLMIFAMNYGNVAPRQPAVGGATPVLAWSRESATVWVLTLVEPCADLKGLHLTARLPEGSCVVSPGALLGGQTGPVFVRNIDRNGLDVSVALIGRGATLTGAGELLRVTTGADLGRASISARGADNADLATALAPTAAPLPTAFAVKGNYPNPFNPQTTIVFALPEARDVQVRVYALDGSLVRTLVRERLASGRHDIVWDGRDALDRRVASGAYFCRVDAGLDGATFKMVLTK